MTRSSERPLKITADELSRAVPLGARGIGKPLACPVCGTVNDAGAIECRSCGEAFRGDPVAARMSGRPAAPRCRPEELASARVSATVLFLCGLTVVLAPLVILLGGLLLIRRHRALVQAGPAYVGLAYTAVALSLVYFTLAVVFLLNAG